jgi:hypothetical protein
MYRRFTEAEIEQVWDMHQTGVPVKRIARTLGRQNVSLRVLISKSGGIRPRARVANERHLSLAEREEISRGLAAGVTPSDRRGARPSALDPVSRGERQRWPMALSRPCG